MQVHVRGQGARRQTSSTQNLLLKKNYLLKRVKVAQCIVNLSDSNVSSRFSHYLKMGKPAGLDCSLRLWCKSTQVCYVAPTSLHRQRVELSKQNSARYLHFDKSADLAGHHAAENSLIS